MKSRVAFALVVAALAGCGDDSPVKPAPQGPTDAAGTVTALGEIYEARNLTAFTALLSNDFVFVRHEPDPETGSMQWNNTEELDLHRRMFDPASIPAGDVPLHSDFWLQDMNVTLTPMIAFAERTDLYTAANPQGALDSNRWIARGATYTTNAFFALRGDTDYHVVGRAYFVVLEDRTKQLGDAGKFLLYRWEDLGTVRPGSEGPAVEPRTWSNVKSLYRRGRRAPPEVGGLIDRLAESYRTRDLNLFSGLLVSDFRFVLGHPDQGTGEEDWGAFEERNLHRRMLTPSDRPPGEPPVSADLVVQAIHVTLFRETSFVERRDLYTTASPRGPLDPGRWIAQGAIYGTDAFFQLAGETDYQVSGRAEFVILEDRALSPAHPSKFVLYRWKDLGYEAAPGNRTSGVEATTWSGMKSLYRLPAYDVPTDPAAVVQALANAYQRRDAENFEALLSPDYLFLLDRPDDNGEYSWDKTTEAHLHRRMLDPQEVLPGDPPLSPEFWLQEAIVALVPESEFTERPDLYTTSDPPGPLDPTRWTASGAVYGANAFFQLQGDTDYQVGGRAYFLVLEDRTKPLGDPGRLQLYRWEDLGQFAGDLYAVQPSWTRFKKLYKR